MSAGKQITFIAKSAAEAVERVRNELGSEGRVVSVRQVTGSGLQRFLAAPRLEIVAKVEPQDAAVTAGAPAHPAQRDDAAAAEQQGARLRSDEEALPWQQAEDAAAQEEPPLRGVIPPAATRSCGELLKRAGFSPSLMARLEGHEEWRSLCRMPVVDGLPRAVAWLRRFRGNRSGHERPAKLAFVGGPGVGKTTSLCKYLAREVFIHNRQPQVLQLEVERPHMDNGLGLYCEILGLSCVNDPADLDSELDQPLLVDIPGFALHATEEHHAIRKALDELGVVARALVLNAAYDHTVIQQFVAAGDRIGAAFTVWTHLDEMVEFGKLWARLLDPDRHVLFFANGQNIAGDIIDDPFGFMMHKTFPG
jgi:flagellar biosynthesis protein FlhF